MLKWINKKRNTKGFTLVELIVVIAILGILAAIAIPRFTGFTDSARENTAESNKKLVNSMLAVYYADNGFYPKVNNFEALIDKLKEEDYIDEDNQESLKDEKSWVEDKTPTYSSGDETITIPSTTIP